MYLLIYFVYNLTSEKAHAMHVAIRWWSDEESGILIVRYIYIYQERIYGFSV